MRRRDFLLSCAGFSLASGFARAGGYPDRIVTLINPFAPGGVTDILARVVADGLSTELGQRVIVDTRAGAGGNIGLQFTARSPADGYTLAMYPTSSVIAPSVYKNLKYDPINDLSAIALVGKTPALLVVYPELPIHSVADLISYAKANPGKLSYASTGYGTSPHLYTELFRHMTGIDIVHVPYSGQAPTITDQIAGRIDMSFQAATAVIEYVRNGQMRALATSTVESFEQLPDLPPIAKTVPGFDASNWFGMVAPAGVPKPIIQKLNADVMKVLAQPSVKTRWSDLAVTVSPNSADEFAAFIHQEHDKWAGVAKVAGIKPQ